MLVGGQVASLWGLRDLHQTSAWMYTTRPLSARTFRLAAEAQWRRGGTDYPAPLKSGEPVTKPGRAAARTWGVVVLRRTPVRVCPRCAAR